MTGPRDDLVEQVAADVHAAWMEAKRAQGITSRPSADGVEQMVPYDDLPDDLQELDRATVRAVFASPALQAALERPAAAGEALTAAESILSLLRYRRIVDTPRNRADVERALALVQYALGYRTSHPGPFPPVDLDERRRHGVEIPWQHTHPPLDACTPSCPRWEALQAEKRAAAAAENPPMAQQPDGSWAPAEPLPYQGRVAKVEQWARRRGWKRVAYWLAAWDERNLGR